MARGPRRYVKSENDESEDESLPPMSPNTLKEHQLKLIQRMDLCEENADAIKTSDYSSRPRLFPATSIMPECSVKGTEAARIASGNSAATSRWQAFGQSDEAVDALFTQKQVGNGNSHRHNMRQQKREEEERLGRKLDLEDTYNDYGGNRRTSTRISSNHTRPPPLPFAQSIFSAHPPSAAPEESVNVKRSKGVQARPWPPPALEGTPSMALAMKVNQPFAKLTAAKVPAMPASSLVPVNAADPKRRSLTLPARSHGFKLVEDPSHFMSSVKNKLAAWSPEKVVEKGEKQTKAQETSTSDTNAAQDTLIASATEPAAQLKKTSTADLRDPSIRRVPVTEFSFSAANALAPGDVSTHTDGAPSPAALSGFSTSSTTREETSTRIHAVTNDLIGLGIGDAGLMSEVHGGGAAIQTSPLSPTGSILDSPILDNVSSEVLAANTAKVVIIDGCRYVPESELLNLKAMVQSQLSSAPPSLVPRSTPSGPIPEAAPDTQPAVASSTPAFSTASSAIRPSRPVNPFAPREPLAINDTNIAAAPASASPVKQNPDPPSATAKPAARPPSVVTSNKTIYSKWADEPSSRPTNPSTTPAIRSLSSIIGDRKVFGHLSKEAAQGQKYDPPPPRIKHPVASKRFSQAPGPGLTWLLKEMADAGHLNSAVVENDEEL